MLIGNTCGHRCNLVNLTIPYIGTPPWRSPRKHCVRINSVSVSDCPPGRIATTRTWLRALDGRAGEAQKLDNDTDSVSRLKRRLVAFAADEGTVTVEFMLWLPIIFTVILFAIDVALIYLKQADMWNVARDISRRMAQSSAYATSGNAPNDARARLFASLQSATITAVSCGAPPTLPNPASPCSANPSGSVPNFYEVVTIQIPICTASLFGVVGCFNNTDKLTARATMVSEY